MCPNFIYWILQVLKDPKVSKSLINQGLLASFLNGNGNRDGHTDHGRRYCISCSKFSNIGETKKSKIVISSPSHIFLIVDTVVVEFFLLTMLFSVDCVMPQMVESLFNVILCRWHNSSIRNLTASLTFMLPPNSIGVNLF